MLMARKAFHAAVIVCGKLAKDDVDALAARVAKLEGKHGKR